MIELLFFVVAVIILTRAIRDLQRPVAAKAVTHSQKSPQLAHFETYANRLYGERQYLAAEKAYLKVLKLNHKDQHAYNRLGMIYVALKNYPDAIECFQIAAQLKPSAAGWYNLGLAYFENDNAIKAISAIEKSIMFEPTAARFVTLARAYTKVSNSSKAISALERASDLESSKKTLSLLAEAYTKNHDREKAVETYQRILEIDPTDAKAKRLAGTTVS